MDAPSQLAGGGELIFKKKDMWKALQNGQKLYSQCNRPGTNTLPQDQIKEPHMAKKAFVKLKNYIFTALLRVFTMYGKRWNKVFLDRFQEFFPRVEYIKCKTCKRVECDRKAQVQYTCIPLAQHLNGMRRFKDMSNIEKTTLIDSLLTSILPHVHVRGTPVKLEDCVVVDVLAETGAYFPSFHTDVEWNSYPGDGFQVWYLVDHDGGPSGNMFIWENPPETSESTFVRAIDNSTELQALSHRDHALIKCKTNAMPVKYLDFKPGDCFVFGQNLYHMSDFRATQTTRYAINFRVLVRRCDGSIPTNFRCESITDAHECAYKWRHNGARVPTRYQNAGIL